MKAIVLAVILALTTISAKADEGGLYLSLGASYVEDIEIIKRASVTFGNYTVSAEASATLDLEVVAPMAKLGYRWRGWSAELDYIGTSNTNVRRINVFYTFNFN